MTAILPEPIRRQVEQTVRTTSAALGIVDIRAMAAEIRAQFPSQDIAIPDIAATAIQFAGQCGITVELSGPVGR